MKRLLAFLLLSTWSFAAYSAISQLATETCGIIDGESSINLSHTVDAGTDLLVVLVGYSNKVETPAASWNDPDPDEPLTLQEDINGSAQWEQAGILTKTTPTTGGPGTLNVSFGQNVQGWACAINLDGVDTSTPVGNTNTGTSGANLGVAVTNDDADDWALGVVEGNSTCEVSCSDTEIYSTGLVTRAVNVCYVAGTGSQEVTWTSDCSGTGGAVIQVNVESAAGPTLLQSLPAILTTQ